MDDDRIHTIGDSRFDGYFTAVEALRVRSFAVRTTFEQELRALGNVFELGDTPINAEYVTELVAAIRADVDASISGPLRIQYREPRCAVDVSIAVDAQVDCLSDDGTCEVATLEEEGTLAKCDGVCMGECSEQCADGAGVSCVPPNGSEGCDVGCDGVCALAVPSPCDGVCRGQCSGGCSVITPNDQGEPECTGKCDGVCDGVCDASDTAPCAGTCHGICHASMVPSECSGVPVTCHGECGGTCEGECAGVVVPSPSGDGCREQCSGQASARASASLACTPPSFEFSFDLEPGLGSEQQARFLSRIDRLDLHLTGALQAAAEARAFANGQLGEDMVLPESLLSRVMSDLDGLEEEFEGWQVPEEEQECVSRSIRRTVMALERIRRDLFVASSLSVELFELATSSME